MSSSSNVHLPQSHDQNYLCRDAQCPNVLCQNLQQRDLCFQKALYQNGLYHQNAQFFLEALFQDALYHQNAQFVLEALYRQNAPYPNALHPSALHYHAILVQNALNYLNALNYQNLQNTNIMPPQLPQRLTHAPTLGGPPAAPSHPQNTQAGTNEATPSPSFDSDAVNALCGLTQRTSNLIPSNDDLPQLPINANNNANNGESHQSFAYFESTWDNDDIGDQEDGWVHPALLELNAHDGQQPMQQDPPGNTFPPDAIADITMYDHMGPPVPAAANQMARAIANINNYQHNAPIGNGMDPGPASPGAMLNNTRLSQNFQLSRQSPVPPLFGWEQPPPSGSTASMAKGDDAGNLVYNTDLDMGAPGPDGHGAYIADGIDGSLVEEALADHEQSARGKHAVLFAEESPADHQQSAHGKHKYVCLFNFVQNGCGLSFGGKYEWSRHMSTQHLMVSVSCIIDTCHNRFKRDDSMIDHVIRIHWPGDLRREHNDRKTKHNDRKTSHQTKPPGAPTQPIRNRHNGHMNENSDIPYPDIPCTDHYRKAHKELKASVKAAFDLRGELPPNTECNAPRCPSKGQPFPTWKNFTDHVAKHWKQDEHLGHDFGTELIGHPAWHWQAPGYAQKR